MPRMERATYTLDAELTLRVGETLLANSRRIELLKQIEVTENLTKSAKIAGFSYKSAWDTIEKMTQLTGGQLLEKHAGGKGGGKTRLTDRGKQLLKNLTLIQGEHARFIQRLNRLANGLDADYALLTEIAMKTSARNQLAAIIVNIFQGPVHDEITLKLHGNQMLTSSITHESSRELKLDIGTKVFALIKASSVGIRRRSDVAHGMTLNVLDGIASTVVAGEQKSEVAVLLDGGTELIATIPNPELLSLNIRPGDPVAAVFDHANVIIGIAA